MSEKDPTGYWIRLVPNLLSALRLGLAVAFPFLATAWQVPAIVLAGLSDAVDGFIARRFRVTSWIGGLLDAFADKTFVLTVLITLGVRGQLAWWQLAALILRDVAVALAVTYATATRDWAAFRRMPSRLAGKLTTVGLFLFLVVVILWPQARLAGQVVFALTAACSAWAAAVYLICFARGLAEKRQA